MTGAGVSPTVGAGPASLAVDVGGTGIKAALVDATGSFVDSARVPTPVDRAGSEEGVLEAVRGLLEGLQTRNPGVRVERVGLCLPGIVDEDTGTAVYSDNLFWRDVPFEERARAVLGLPSAITHDIAAGGRAEYELGAARGQGNVVVMIIGTGIAAALFLDGRPYRAGGFAGEVGHIRVSDAGPDCVCGQSGCLEAIASAAAIARRYEEATGHRVDGARDVLSRVQASDASAREVWSSAMDALAESLAQITGLLAPDAVVLAGGLSAAGEDLLTPLRAALSRRLTFHRAPDLVIGGLGPDAGIVGAALLTRDDARFSQEGRA